MISEAVKELIDQNLHAVPVPGCNPRGEAINLLGGALESMALKAGVGNFSPGIYF